MSDDQITRIENKVDSIVERIGSIDVTIGKQEVSLSEHIRRTEILETRIEPIEKNMNYIHGVLKLIGLIATVVCVAEGIVSILKYLGH